MIVKYVMLYFNVVISYEIENKTEKKCKQKKDCVTPQTSGPRSSPPTTPYDSLTLLMFFFCFFFLLFFSSSSPRLKVPSSPMLSIPYRTGQYGRNIPYRPAIRYVRPPCFVPEKIPAVPANFGQYRSVQKKVFFFFFFLSFVIFEFLLGQNGNLFALTY